MIKLKGEKVNSDVRLTITRNGKKTLVEIFPAESFTADPGAKKHFRLALNRAWFPDKDTLLNVREAGIEIWKLLGLQADEPATAKPNQEIQKTPAPVSVPPATQPETKKIITPVSSGQAIDADAFNAMSPDQQKAYMVNVSNEAKRRLKTGS